MKKRVLLATAAVVATVLITMFKNGIFLAAAVGWLTSIAMSVIMLYEARFAHALAYAALSFIFLGAAYATSYYYVTSYTPGVCCPRPHVLDYIVPLLLLGAAFVVLVLVVLVVSKWYEVPL